MWADPPPADPQVEFVVASHGMSKGISQTDGPQVITKALVEVGEFQLGGQWKNVTSNSAAGEAAAVVAATHRFGSFQLSGGVAYKLLTRVHGTAQSTSWEFSAGASRKFSDVSLRMNAIFSPDDLGPARRSLFVEAGPAVQLAKGWTVSAAVGHRSRERAPDYTAVNVGIAKSIHHLQLDLRYFDTNRSRLGVPYRARVVASARLAF